MVPLSVAKDKSFSIPEVHITAHIQPNGDILFSEARTYRFRGSFSTADYHLPRRGFAEISEISVSEPHVSYQQNQSEMNRTYQVHVSSDAVHISWFYQARSETRTFIISYRLGGALVVGPEVTEWIWMHIDGRGWNLTTEAVTVDIFFPDEISEQDLRLWKRGKRDAFDISYFAQGIRLQGGPITRRDFIETRLLFPTRLLDAPEVTEPNLTIANVTRQEQERQEQEALREMQRMENRIRAQKISYVLIGLCLFFIVYFRLRYPPARSSKLVEEFATQPPQDHPVLSMWLYLNRTLWPHVQIGALFNLARLGYLRLREVPGEDYTDGVDFVLTRTDQTATSDLPEWDKNMLTYIEARAHAGDSRLSRLLKADSMTYVTWNSSWKKLVKEAGEQREWYQTEHKPAMILAIVIHTLFILASVPLMLFKAWSGLALAVLGIAGIFFSMMIVRRTESGEEYFQHIKSYHNALKKLPRERFNAQEAPLHFIYAIMFKLNKKAMGVLFDGIDTNSSDNWNWLIYTSGTLTPARLSGIVAASSSIGSYSGSISGSGSSMGSGGGGASGGAR